MGLVTVLFVLGLAGVLVRRRIRARARRRLITVQQRDLARKAVDEDLAQFADDLADLYFETLTDEPGSPLCQDFDRAVDCYERARSLRRHATATGTVKDVTRTLEYGRHTMACVLARRRDQTVPERRPPCFLNPAHGPAEVRVDWAPEGQPARQVPVCRADSDRLVLGVAPEFRLVRAGGRYVPWFQAGPAYTAYAEGYFGAHTRAAVPHEVLTTLDWGADPPSYDTDLAGTDWYGAHEWDQQRYAERSAGVFGYHPHDLPPRRRPL